MDDIDELSILLPSCSYRSISEDYSLHPPISTTTNESYFNYLQDPSLKPHYLPTHRIPINYGLHNIRSIEYPRRISFNKNSLTENESLYRKSLSTPINKLKSTTKRYQRNFHSFTLTNIKDIDKELILHNIIENFKEYQITYIIVSYEHDIGHAPHYHVVFNTIHKIVTNNLSIFKVISKDKNGKIHNVHVVERNKSSQMAAIRYITKEKNTNDVLVYGNIPQLQEAKEKITDVVAKSLMGGEKTLKDVVEQYPGFSLNNMVKIKVFNDTINSLKTKVGKKQWDISFIDTSKFTAKEMIIYKWFKKNLPWINNNNHERALRKNKQLQLFIKAGVNSGKSTLLRLLGEFFARYIYPRDDWHNDYSDENTDIVTFDEFSSNMIEITMLNAFSEGSEVKLRVKNSQYLKQSNPPIIICCNYTLSSVYKKDIARSPSVESQLKSRFLSVEFDEDVFGNPIETMFNLIDSLKECKYKVYFDQANEKGEYPVDRALKKKRISLEMYKKIKNQKQMNLFELFKSRIINEDKVNYLRDCTSDILMKNYNEDELMKLKSKGATLYYSSFLTIEEEEAEVEEHDDNDNIDDDDDNENNKVNTIEITINESINNNNNRNTLNSSKTFFISAEELSQIHEEIINQ